MRTINQSRYIGQKVTRVTSIAKRMNNKIIVGLFVGTMLLTNSSGYGNGLVISGVVSNQAAKTVTFNLSWDNSWRVVTNPFNWDAAWVFVKFRQCGAAPTTDWSHGQISTTLGDHTIHANLEPTTSNGLTAPGIDAAPNNLGVMLRRSAIGVFPTTAPLSNTLKVTNIPAVVAGVSYDYKVFGIEMVFIPEGSFSIGDDQPNCLAAAANAQGRFNNGQSIISEAAVTLNSTFTVAVFTGMVAATHQVVPVPATYPKGFAPFYMMKYEISQNQYCQFLNTITAVASTARFPGNYNTNRNLTNNNGTPPDIYQSIRPYRAQGWLDMFHVFSYLDWACLRPMTELEYEKTCRGAGAMLSCEGAWGVSLTGTPPVAATTVSTTVPCEDGTEIVLAPANANCAWNNPVLIGVCAGETSGPLRVGIFARAGSTTRAETGATYFGVMEMSGNLWEVSINVMNLAGCLAYTATWGDGYLDATGMFNAPTWPLTSANSPNQTVGNRGGSFWDANQYLTIGNRYCNFWPGGTSPAGCGATQGRGGRGVR